MLSAHEFTVGAFKDASPTSLILPRTEHEQTVLIGHIENKPAAVLLSGQFANEYFLTAESENWHGLLIPNVRIEVDETSCFDPFLGNQIGAIVRGGTRLSIRAKADRSMSAAYVTLQDSLPPTGDYRAGFSRWQVVLGEGFSKRVLWSSPSPKT
ncbi:hypothetical protein GGD56_006079 [Rhizobium mongolense]|uniref:Uncharacterized protein n=2 Tax=Rhizobium mongolense TaxID=57676 RepID=A0ABR6IW92_9HYPH|nr:hypothetical protein [Rhizobium mongolense]TVZ63096.1 hypothetical protein BCL32_3213 [Rhizobium mongolense USDA 1844]